MFLTLDVVNKETAIYTDKYGRKVQGFKTKIEKETLNLANLFVVKELSIKDYYPDPESSPYPTDVSDIQGKQLSLLIFNFGNVSAEKVVVYPFSELSHRLSDGKKGI